MYRLSNRGLGSKEDLPQSIFGGNVDCRNLMTYAFTPECWDYTRDAWGQMVAFSRPTSAIISPPPAVDRALSTVPAPYTTAEAEAAVSESIARGKSVTDRNIMDFFSGVPYVSEADSDKSGLPWWVWLAGGLGVFALVAVSGGSPRRYGR